MPYNSKSLLVAIPTSCRSITVAKYALIFIVWSICGTFTWWNYWLYLWSYFRSTFLF